MIWPSWDTFVLVICEEIEFVLLASILIHTVNYEMSISSTNLLPNSSEIVFDDANARTYLTSIIHTSVLYNYSI